MELFAIYGFVADDAFNSVHRFFYTHGKRTFWVSIVCRPAFLLVRVLHKIRLFDQLLRIGRVVGPLNFVVIGYCLPDVRRLRARH